MNACDDVKVLVIIIVVMPAMDLNYTASFVKNVETGMTLNCRHSAMTPEN